MIDEWGNWHKGGTGPSKGYNMFEQKSNMRDAIVAAMTLNIFNNRCDVVGMANVAQLCNNLHSLYLAGGDQFVETPNYYVFDMFRGHKGGKQLKTVVSAKTVEHRKYEEMSTLSASASVQDGTLTLTVANLDVTAAKEVSISGLGGRISGQGTLRLLTHKAPNTCNTFEEPYAVVPAETAVALQDGDTIFLPAASIASLSLRLAE